MMPAQLARLDLRWRRRSLLAYCLGMAAYAFVVVAIYPSFKDSTSLNALTKGGSSLAALFGATGSLTSPPGWLDVNLYKNFVPLIVLLLTVGYGASSLAGLDEEGVLGLLASLPLTRRRVVGEKAAAMAAQAFVVAVVVAVFVEAGRWFQLAIPLAHLLGLTVAVGLLGVDFGLVALAVGAGTGSRGVALGIGAGAAAASYVVSSLWPVASWIRPARYLSLFFWAVGNSQSAHGVSVAAYGVLLGAGAVLLAVAAAVFERLDIR